MDWSLAAGTIGRAVVAYVLLIVYIRVSGNRTLAKLRAFDLVVTIALGSLLGSTIVLSTVPVWQGLVAMGALIGLQYVVAAASVRWTRIERLVTTEAILLYREGGWNERGLRRARVTREEVEGEMRAAGHASPDTVVAAWLESNGTVSVSPLLARERRDTR